MADNRQFADHVEIGGANVYFQETSTTDTTMPSTSFFKTEDVDGKPVIISRDNIMGIVKDCLGSILNGLTDQTTVTKVPTLNGDTLGASAVSTLASVLGGVAYYRGEISSLSSLVTAPAGLYTSPSNTQIANVPGQAAFIKLYDGSHTGNYNRPILAYNSQVNDAGGKGLYIFDNTNETFVKIVSFT